MHDVKSALVALVVGVLTLAATAAAAQDLTLVSNASQTTQTGNGMSILATSAGGRTMSADGRYLVFVSEATNLVASQVDANGQSDVFLHDRVNGTTTLVSHALGTAVTTANGFSLDPVISADGAFVTFISDATDLVAGSDGNGDFDVFLYERATGAVTLVSHVPGAPATAGNAGSFGAVISADGGVVAFESLATDLVAAADTNGTFDVFVYTHASGAVTLVSHASGAPGTAANDASLGPALSASGAFVAFGSLATDLVTAADTNGAGDVFLYERATDTTTLVSHAAGAPGTAGNASSSSPVISADGGVVAFQSLATNLVAGSDGNGDLDVFVYERATGAVTLVSHVPGAPATSANGVSLSPVVSADGAFVAFVSEGTDLVSGSDANADFDVFLYERATGAVTLVSHVPGAPGTTGNSGSLRPDVSSDGAIVAFDSLAGDLVSGTDTPGTFDLFRYERATGVVTLISHIPGAPGIGGNHSSGAALMSADGAIIALETDATNLLMTADDNIVSDVLVYKRTPIADLVESALTSPPASAVPGAAFTVTDTVLNQGDAPAGASTTRYYLSSDTLKSPDDLQLAATRSVAGLASGASSAGARTLTIPSATAVGAYFVLACADDTRVVSERDELNNCRASATPVVVGRPDLVILTVSSPPPKVAPGTYFSITDTILNRGSAGASGSGTRYYLSFTPGKTTDSKLLTGTHTIGTLAPSAQSTGAITLTVPTTMPLATYTLVACADDFFKVIEMDESNNCTPAAGQVSVERPDLVVTAVTDPPTVVLPGGSFAVTDTVVNEGGVTAGASATRYYLSLTTTKSQSKLLSGTRTLTPLAPGATSQAAKTVTVPTATPLQTYYLLACADDLFQVVEMSETNNCAVATTRVRVARPDLIESIVSDPPATAARGSTFQVTDTVTNVGGYDAPASTTRYYLSANTVRNSGDALMAGSRAVGALAPDASSAAPSPVTVTVPSAMPAGTYYLLACADDMARITEASETNNCRASTDRVVVP